MKKHIEVKENSIDWVLISKGIGIVLVVISHFHPKSSPTYWTEMRSIIYSFHMPLFFLLSGYLYTHGKYSYLILLKKKLRRLLYPFISIAALFFFIKYSASYVVEIDYPVDIESLIALIIDPVNSYMPLLWFVHALFIIFIIYPLLRYLTNNAIIIFFAAIVASYYLSYTLVIGKSLYNFPFFIAGISLKENNHLNNYLVNSSVVKLLITVAVFIISYIFHYSANFPGVTAYFIRIILGLSGSMVVIFISQLIVFSANIFLKNIALSIGYYSMTIYLFHTLFESSVRIGFLRVFSNISIPFEIVALIAIVCGVIFPLLLEKFIIRKSPHSRKYILGIS